MLSRVDLPHPLGPMRATTSPSRTAKLTPATAASPLPEAAMKRMVTLRYSSRTTSDIVQKLMHANRALPAHSYCRTIAWRIEAGSDISARAASWITRRGRGRDVRTCDENIPPPADGRRRRLWFGTVACARLRAGAGKGHVSVSGTADSAGVRADPARPGQGLLQLRRPRCELRSRPRRRRRGEAG